MPDLIDKVARAMAAEKNISVSDWERGNTILNLISRAALNEHPAQRSDD